MTFVDLTLEEVRFGATIGLERRMTALELGRRETYGHSPADTWSTNIMGALGELAVAKLLGLEFNPGREVDPEGDVIPGLQVRTTAHAKGKLIVYPRDAPDHKYVLVRGVAPRLEVAGWLFGHECQSQEHWNTGAREPSYWVDARFLRPVPDRRLATV